MLTGLFLIFIIVLLLFFICALKLSSDSDREISDYLQNEKCNKNDNIAK